MANSTLVGNCLPPFLDASRFPADGGFLPGRLCAPIPSLKSEPICCLPCPATEWAYSDSFKTYGVVSDWLNVLGLVLLLFMLLSYAVLPAQQTRSHYLSICLVISIMMICLGFTIPLSVKPEQCYNEITPHDMYTSDACAWSGAFIIAGGLTADMWIFIRALSMNLQICWDIVPGRKFFYFSQLFGWGIPAVLCTITITLTGVSFRFGNACHVNHKDSMQDFWGPLLAFAGASGVLQLCTFAYCINVYLKSLWSGSTEASATASGTDLPSYQGSVRTQTARIVYRRLKKVLWLQWRGICIVSIILVDVIFFSIVFVNLDSMQATIFNDLGRARPWLTCLALNPTDKSVCLSLVNDWLVKERTVIAVLLLLSLAGLQVFLLLMRPSIFPAWRDFLQSLFSPKRQEFVSLDAKKDIARSNSKHGLLQYQRGYEATNFEMQVKPSVSTIDIAEQCLSPTMTSPSETYTTPLQRQGPIHFSSPHMERGHRTPEYSDRITPPIETPGIPSAARFPYQRSIYQREGSSEHFSEESPTTASERMLPPAPRSFSRPRAPSSSDSTKPVAFDLRDPYARGGLALNPPSEAGESREDVSTMGRRGRL